MVEESLNVIAIIPARGGSKRIPGKNLLPLAGMPLVAHSILHALASQYVQRVYISTEDKAIAAVASQYGAAVIERPPNLASDTATSESALLHVLDEHLRLGNPEPDLIVFLQPTSPVRRVDDIDQAIRTLLNEQADSIFSACENNRLIWAVKDGQPFSINYDYHKRQREQDMAIQFRENGSIYVFKPQILRETGNRLGGKMVLYEMDYWSSFQIDLPEHAELISWIMQRPGFAPIVKWPTPIELVVFDFDGVMTDNTLIVTETGEEAVRCHRGDGWGIARLREAGVPMMVLSTEANEVVARRSAKLKIDCHHSIGDKAAYLQSLIAQRGINAQNVVYLGNDVNDLDCLKLVGMPVVVADSHPEVLRAARLILSRRGGDGAVRELCDQLLNHLSSIQTQGT